MSPNVGLNVLEVDGLAAPTIEAAPTSVGAFVGVAERGVPDTAVRVSDLGQYRARFGLNRSDALLGYAIEGFFLNGGREAYVTRVVGPSSAPASAALDDRQAAPEPTLRVAAGYRGAPDPGTWGERIRIDVRDDARGQTTLSGPTTANNATLQSLAGVSVGSVLRLADTATPANVFFRKVTSLDQATRQVSWADPIGPVLPVATTVVATAEFRLVVRYRTSATAAEQVVEDWRNLSMETDSIDYVADRINHTLTGSRYVTVGEISGSAASGVENPALVASRQLTGSSEAAPGSTQFIGDAAAGTGLHAFDVAQVQLVAAPDVHGLSAAGRDAVVQGALDYCAGRGDCMYVGAAPDRGRKGGVTIPRAIGDYAQLESDYVQSAGAYGRKFQAAKVYGALYAPWVRVADPTAAGPAPSRFIPPEGHIMGVYARSELERGIWKAPAGAGAGLRGALEVAAAFDDTQHDGLVRGATVNGIRRQEGLGITVSASRTLSTDTRWWFVNVRLLFNFVKSSLRQGLRFVRQEPHTDALRRTVSNNVVRPFLLGLWRNGAFGSDPADDVFTIKCDAENNPPNEVDLGNFRIEVYFYPVKPAETVLIVVGQQPSGSSAGES